MHALHLITHAYTIMGSMQIALIRFYVAPKLTAFSFRVNPRPILYSGVGWNE